MISSGLVDIEPPVSSPATMTVSTTDQPTRYRRTWTPVSEVDRPKTFPPIVMTRPPHYDKVAAAVEEELVHDANKITGIDMSERLAISQRLDTTATTTHSTSTTTSSTSTTHPSTTPVRPHHYSDSKTEGASSRNGQNPHTSSEAPEASSSKHSSSSKRRTGSKLSKKHKSEKAESHSKKSGKRRTLLRSKGF